MRCSSESKGEYTRLQSRPHQNARFCVSVQWAFPFSSAANTACVGVGVGLGWPWQGRVVAFHEHLCRPLPGAECCHGGQQRGASYLQLLGPQVGHSQGGAPRNTTRSKHATSGGQAALPGLRAGGQGHGQVTAGGRAGRASRQAGQEPGASCSRLYADTAAQTAGALGAQAGAPHAA